MLNYSFKAIYSSKNANENETITVTLLANGEETENTVTLNKENTPNLFFITDNGQTFRNIPEDNYSYNILMYIFDSLTQSHSCIAYSLLFLEKLRCYKFTKLKYICLITIY